MVTHVGDSVNVGSSQAEMTDDLETAIVSRQVKGSPAILHKKYESFFSVKCDKNSHKALDIVNFELINVFLYNRFKMFFVWSPLKAAKPGNVFQQNTFSNKFYI